jgi:hypothetical protein
MKNIILFILLIASFGASAQNQDVNPYGGKYYNDHSNYRMAGANGLPRTDHTNLDTLTNVLKGDLRFDTLNRFFVGYDGSQWQDLSFGRVRDTSITIANDAVLTLYSSPVTIVSAYGSGYAIEVVSSFVKIDYNSIAYATNTTLQLVFAGAGFRHKDYGAVLSATSAIISSHDGEGGGALGDMMENVSLTVKVLTGDPTAGNSDIKVYLRYRIITL